MTHPPTPRRWGLSPDHADLVTEVRRPRPLALEAASQRITLDLSRTALLVIDMQNDFCTQGGWLSSIGVDVSPAREAVAALSELLPDVRAAGMPVVWVNWGVRPDQVNLPANVVHVYDPDGSGGGMGQRAGHSEAVLTAGSWGAAIVDELTPGPEDLRVDKHRMSGFFDTPLDSILRRLEVRTLLFAGVNADQCVLATLTDAACLGYDAVLVEGASATTSPSYCYDATVYNVRQCFGFTTTSRSLIAALQQSR